MSESIRNRITYVSYYSRPDDPQGRQSVPACTDKMESILDTLTDLGYSVEILSACGSDRDRPCPGRVDRLSKLVSLRFFRCFPWTSVFSKLACRVSVFGGLLLRLLRLAPQDRVIVYHAMEYIPIVGFAHTLRRFQMILEVEEIYSDVTGDRKKREKEVAFLRKADRYIFPTRLLEQSVNADHKPFAIIHGTYRVQPEREKAQPDGRPDESGNRIHCVYAGTFDPRKGGALAAVAAATFLPEDYHIHIIGFGSRRDTEELQAAIEAMDRESKCRVSFDGLKRGEDYIRFLQGCQIGLSTQDPNAAFCTTSFPSKVLSYLANGLRVVSVRIPAVEGSAVGYLLTYYDDPSPEAIAKAILSVDLSREYDSRKTIHTLAKGFENDLKTLLEGDPSGEAPSR